MAKSPEPELPPCYAMVLPGLEEVASEEITDDLGGDVRKTGRGLVVFRADIDRRLLRLRTTEDVFLYAWGTDQLTYRAADLEKIQRWTARAADWDHLLRLHHGVRPKPRGKPTYHLVTQMSGKHGYLRKHAHEALARGLAGKLPASWRHAEENASVEVWLTIQGATAVCGLRLSDRTMRHRTYKVEHLPASLRPTLAAAMVRLAGTGSGQVFVDPMCGAGTILAEAIEGRRGGHLAVTVLGGDLDRSAVRLASANLARLEPALLARWDAARLPLANGCVDRVVSNPPFGKRVGEPEEIGPLYARMVREYDRILKPGGQAVLLVADPGRLRDAIRGLTVVPTVPAEGQAGGETAGWKSLRQVPVQVLGQRAVISVWRKPGG
jgi:23S rRNA G2445 N2-methylase RlmL